MKIWILRHGEAERQTQYDPERALTERGTRDANVAGELLSKVISPALHIYASPYKRAQQTACAAMQALPQKNFTTVEWLTPDNDPTFVLHELNALKLSELLLVSHQPLVSALLGLLVHGDYRAGPPMDTASLAEIELNLVAPGSAKLISLRHAPHYEKAQI